MKLFCLTLLSACVSVSAQENWPSFRGLDSRGVAPHARIPESWDTEQNVAWKAAVPGMGWSSPIVWKDVVILTSVTREGEFEPPKKGLYYGGERPNIPKENHHWMVLAYDLNSGKERWRKEVHSGAPPSGIHVKNTYASETPVTDGERIYAYFGNVGLFCLDMKGNVLWSKNLGNHKTRYSWGTAASPVLHGDRLFIVNDNEEKSFVAAFDKKTGAEIWRTDRDEKSNWATPYVWTHDGGSELVTPGTQKVRSYDLDGRLLWELKGMSSITIATPYSAHGLLYVTSGYVGDQHRPIYAIRPGARGDISLQPPQTSNQFIAWYQRAGAPYNPSTLLVDDLLYVLYDFGFFGCFDARTGQPVYDKQRFSSGGSVGFTSSPWAAGGKIYCLSEDGDTYVIQPGREFKIVGKNSLSEMCMATPAVAKDRLLIRTASKLYCIKQP